MFGFIKGQSKIINKRSGKTYWTLYIIIARNKSWSTTLYIYLNRNKVQALAISHNEYNNEIVSTEDSIREIQWWIDNI